MEGDLNLVVINDEPGELEGELKGELEGELVREGDCKRVNKACGV